MTGIIKWGKVTILDFQGKFLFAQDGVSVSFWAQIQHPFKTFINLNISFFLKLYLATSIDE